MPLLRLHLPTPVAQAIAITSTAHYPGAPDDREAAITATPLPGTHLVAVECSPSTARLIVEAVSRARQATPSMMFRARCTQVIEAVEAAIAEAARIDAAPGSIAEGPAPLKMVRETDARPAGRRRDDEANP